MQPVVSENGNLLIGGTAGDDKIIVSAGAARDPHGTVRVKLNGSQLGSFVPTGKIIAYGRDGNDTIRVATNKRLIQQSELYGGSGEDRLFAGRYGAILDGGADDDLLSGSQGDDTLLGAGGEDKLKGAGGNDLLEGGDDDDTLTGGAGNDIMDGGDGADKLKGGAGDDTLDGGQTTTSQDDAHADRLTGGGGADTYYARLFDLLIGVRDEDELL